VWYSVVSMYVSPNLIAVSELLLRVVCTSMFNVGRNVALWVPNCHGHLFSALPGPLFPWRAQDFFNAVLNITDAAGLSNWAARGLRNKQATPFFFAAPLVL
jgi:hypothetical protein